MSRSQHRSARTRDGASAATRRLAAVRAQSGKAGSDFDSLHQRKVHHADLLALCFRRTHQATTRHLAHTSAGRTIPGRNHHHRHAHLARGIAALPYEHVACYSDCRLATSSQIKPRHSMLAVSCPRLSVAEAAASMRLRWLP